MIRRAAIVALGLALGACAEMRWTKPGADEATLARDSASCRALAAQQAARTGETGLPPASIDPRFGAPSGPSLAQQRLSEREAEEGCMRARGYTLVPGAATGDR